MAVKLTEEQRRFIVMRLAEFATPTQVVAEAQQKWPGLELSKQQVQHYDPTTVQGTKCAKKWRAVFTARRQAYLSAVEDEPFAHRRMRLRKLAEKIDELDAQIDVAKTMGRTGNPRLVADLIERQRSLLEQLAKEVGDVFTNRRKHEGAAVDALAQMLGISPDELEAAD